MGAMRLFSPHELTSFLKQAGCVKTDIASTTSTYWYTEKRTLFSIPEPDAISGQYSDFVYYQIRQFVEDH